MRQLYQGGNEPVPFGSRPLYSNTVKVPKEGMRVRLTDEFDQKTIGTLAYCEPDWPKILVVWDNGVTDRWEPHFLVEVTDETNDR